MARSGWGMDVVALTVAELIWVLAVWAIGGRAELPWQEVHACQGGHWG
jgi:hypothetical protein